MKAKLNPAMFATLALTTLLAALALAGCTQSEPSSSSTPASGSSSSSTPVSSSAVSSAETSSTTGGEIDVVGAEGIYVVALDYNAGTGFEWQCTVEPEGVFYIVDQNTKDASDYDPDNPTTGGPLVDYVTVRASGPGTATLTCQLVRPWEEDEEPAEVQTFTFTVDEALGMDFLAEESSFTNYPETGSNS